MTRPWTDAKPETGDGSWARTPKSARPTLSAETSSETGANCGALPRAAIRPPAPLTSTSESSAMPRLSLATCDVPASRQRLSPIVRPSESRLMRVTAPRAPIGPPVLNASPTTRADGPLSLRAPIVNAARERPASRTSAPSVSSNTPATVSVSMRSDAVPTGSASTFRIANRPPTMRPLFFPTRRPVPLTAPVTSNESRRPYAVPSSVASPASESTSTLSRAPCAAR